MSAQNGASPEPARIVSDLGGSSQSAGPFRPVAGLSTHPRIQAMQRRWDPTSARLSVPSMWESRENLPPGLVRAPSGILPTEEEGQRWGEDATKRVGKRVRPVSDTPSSSSSSSQPPPSKRQQTGRISLSQAQSAGSSSLGLAGINLVRAEARRVTDAAVKRQLAGLTKMQQGQAKDTALEVSSSSETRSESSPDDLGVFDLGLDMLNSKQPYITTGERKGDQVVAIPMAEPGRPYAIYEDSNGRRVSARGALIPANYKLHDDPDRPYICPVRDCRRIFAGLPSLGGHFGAGHCASVFNDNGDGTLTKLADYANVSPGGRPGVVISCNPLPPDALPPTEPSLPYAEALKSAQAQNGGARRPRMVIGSSGINVSPSPIETPVPIPSPYISRPVVQESEVKIYLHAFLIPSQRTYKREDVRLMLTMPQKRSLPESWVLAHRGGDLDANHYACALAYLTGEEVIGEEKCHAREREARGPAARLADKCIRLPQTIPKYAQKMFSSPLSCVGCKYWSHLQRFTVKCDWHAPSSFSSMNIPTIESYINKTLQKPSRVVIDVTSDSDSIPEEDSGSDAIPELESDPEPEPAFGSEYPFESKHPSELPSPIAIESTFEPESAFEPEPEHEPDPESESEPKLDSKLAEEDDDDSMVGIRRTKRKVAAPASYALARAKKSSVPKAQTPELSTITPLEMEDWEVAPGRMTDASSQNIAYSNSYLTSGQPVTVSEDVSFNVLVIKPGSSTHWDVEKSKIRTVSVAAGKVKITMGDRTFNLGPNGMFVVRPGQSCKLENRLYIDSVVHCTTMANF